MGISTRLSPSYAVRFWLGWLVQLLFYVGAWYGQGCPYLLLKSEAEDLLGVWGDAEAVVGAFADEPEYALLGIGEDELCSFLKDVLLAVGEVVADELCSGHAEGDEAVAGLYVAQG